MATEWWRKPPVPGDPSATKGIAASGARRATAKATQESQLRSRTDRSQPAMSWSVSATWSGAENIAQ